MQDGVVVLDAGLLRREKGKNQKHCFCGIAKFAIPQENDKQYLTSLHGAQKGYQNSFLELGSKKNIEIHVYASQGNHANRRKNFC